MARRPVHIPKTALTDKKRAALRASDFAVPSERKYPINDLFHARLALTYVLTPSNAAYRDEVVRAVMARYPELQFWWAAQSRGLAAKRVRKATSRRASGRRMVANPYEEWMDEDELAREQERKARAALLSSLGPNVGSNADWADPAYQLNGKRFLVDSEDGTLDIVKRGRWNKRDEFYEDETLARFDTAAEAAAWLKTQRLRSNPRPKATSRRMPGQRMVANPEREDYPIDPFALLFELERLEEGVKTMSDADVRTALAESKKKLKSAADRLRRVQKGSDRRAATEASQVRGHYAGMAFILETELAERGLRPFPRHENPRREVETEGYFAALEPTRAKYAERSPEELGLMRSRAAKLLRKHAGKSDREVAKALGLDPHDPAVIRQIMLMREHPVLTNPRRKLPKSGEGKGIVSRAERGLGTKYRTMREGMLLEGGDVMLLPHRLPGHEGKRMTDLSEAGREWDYEYNDAKPILDLLAASKAPMLRRTTVAKKLKEEGMSVDEVFRGFAFLRSHGLLKEPREGYVALAKANPRRRGPDARLATLVASGVRRGKKEILEDIQKGRVPRTVKTFSELHDYVDANEYGGLFSDTFQSLPQDTRIAVMEEVQGALDAWLRSRGGHKATPRSKANPRPATRAKRAGGRTAAQSNAAKAMKLFHSGQASSLAEAWAMLRR